MKQLVLFFVLTMSYSAFGQTELLDSIQHVRNTNIPESGKRLCTSGYWAAEFDEAIYMFRQMCEWGDGVELKLQKEQTEKNKAVLTVDFYRDGIPRDRIYIFMDKASGSWLIDGINETENMIKPFLAGLYSGHFSPTDLPTDSELKEFGEKILSFGRNDTELLSFLEENTAPESEHNFISQMTSDMNFELHVVNRVGYEDRTNIGFIHFKGKHKYEEDYYSNITIYVSKTESGKLKILDRVYAEPYASEFFYLIK